MTAHRSAVAHTFALLAALTPIGCLFGDIHLDGEVASGGESSTGSEGEPAQDVTGEQGSGATSDDGATGGASTGATTGGDSGATTSGESSGSGSSGSTGDEPSCTVRGTLCVCDGQVAPLDQCAPCAPYLVDGVCFCDLPIVGTYEIDPAYCV